MSTETLRPNAAGAECNIETQKSQTCPNHYQEVDEAISDEFTTFIRQRGDVSTDWARDLYNIENHSIGSGTINSVKVYALIKSTGENQQDSSLKLVVRSGTTTNESTLQTIRPTVWTLFSATWTTNPDTTDPWTWDEIDGVQAGLTVSVPCNGSIEALTITQVYVEVDYTEAAPVVVTPGTLALTITTYAPTIAISDHKVVTPPKLALLLTTYAPTVSTPRLVTPSTLALVLTTYAPSVLTPVVITPSTLTLSLETYIPTISLPVVVLPSTLDLILTSYAPVIEITNHVTVTPATLALVLNNYTSTIASPRLVTPSTLALILATFAPTVTASDHKLVTPSTLALLLTTYAPAIGIKALVTPSTLALILTLYAPTLIIPDVITSQPLNIRRNMMNIMNMMKTIREQEPVERKNCPECDWALEKKKDDTLYCTCCDWISESRLIRRNL